MFYELNNLEIPVSEEVSRKLKEGHKGDTTGCGDNFAGGVIAGVALQLQSEQSPIDLREALVLGSHIRWIYLLLHRWNLL